MMEILAYGGATIFSRTYAFIAMFIFSRLLQVSDFGLYILAIAVGEFCDAICANWFKVSILRFYHGRQSTDQFGLTSLSPVFLTSLACSLVAVLMVWPIAYILVRDQWPIFASVTSLYVVGNGTIQTSLNALRGEGRAWTFFLIEFFRPLSTLAVGAATAKLLYPTFGVAVLAMFGSYALIGAGTLAILWWHRASGEIVRSRLDEMIAYALPLIISFMVGASMSVADRYQVQWFLGLDAVAIYAAAYMIGRQPIDMLFTTLNLGAFTRLMKGYEVDGLDAAAQNLGQHIARMIGLTLPAVVGLSLLAPQILHTLFDARYWQATPQLIPVIASMAFIAGIKSHGFDQGFHMTRKSRLLVICELPSVVVAIGAGAILIRTIGLIGAAYGTFLGYLLGLTLSGIFVRRLMPVRLPWDEIGKIVASVLIMAVAVRSATWCCDQTTLLLVLTIVLGSAVYGAAVIALNILGARDEMLAMIRTARLWFLKKPAAGGDTEGPGT